MSRSLATHRALTPHSVGWTRSPRWGKSTKLVPQQRDSHMQPTIDHLADGLMRLGYEDYDTYPLAEVEPEVSEELEKRGQVSLKTSGASKLTAKGQKIFTAMEAGEDIPEFDEPD
jgi:hypothetical protein